MWIISDLSTDYSGRQAEYEVTINFKLRAAHLT